MRKDTTQITDVKIIASSLPKSVRSILLESGICPDEFKAEQYLKSGAVIVDRVSAHLGMTVTLELGHPFQLSIYEDRWLVHPVTAEEMLENFDLNERWSEKSIKTSWSN